MQPLHPRTIVIRLSIVVLGLVAASSGYAADPGLTENAALQYWKAFSFLPKLNAEQEKLISHWRTVPLDAQVDELLAASQNSLMFLHRGARLPRCDWGLDDEDGVSMLLPHLAQARTLALIAALQGRRAFERDQRDVARKTAMSIMALARHVGHDPIMICLVVQYGLEDVVIDLVAPHLLDLKIPHAQAAAMYEALPTAATLSEAIMHEKKIMPPSILKAFREADAHRPGGWRQLWKDFLGEGDVPSALQEIHSLEQITELVNGLFAEYDKLAEIVELPEDEFATRNAEFTRQLMATNPTASLLLPNIGKLVAKERRSRARMQLLLAAIAVTENGRDALANIEDPFAEGPFAYEKLSVGFRLSSQLQFEGEPVTLTAGQ